MFRSFHETIATRYWRIRAVSLSTHMSCFAWQRHLRDQVMILYRCSPVGVSPWHLPQARQLQHALGVQRGAEADKKATLQSLINLRSYVWAVLNLWIGDASIIFLMTGAGSGLNRSKTYSIWVEHVLSCSQDPWLDAALSHSRRGWRLRQSSRSLFDMGVHQPNVQLGERLQLATNLRHDRTTRLISFPREILVSCSNGGLLWMLTVKMSINICSSTAATIVLLSGWRWAAECNIFVAQKGEQPEV